MSLLKAMSVAKSYGGRRVVNGISLEVKGGEVVGLLGPNGAGKTTTFHMMVGLVQPDDGHVVMNDDDLTSAPIHRRARAGISYLPQEWSVFRRLTVEENLRAILQTLDLAAAEQQERANALMKMLGVTHLASHRAITLSGGERRLLEISRALVMDPQVLLVDEPSIGLEPRFIDMVFLLLHELQHRDGKTIVMVEQNAKKGLEFADVGYVLVAGEVALAGTGRQLLQNPEVERLFLGGT